MLKFQYLGGGRYYVATHHSFVPKTEQDGLYNFYLDTDLEEEVKKIVRHIKYYALPIVYGFQGDYDYLLGRYNLAMGGVYSAVCNPFFIGVILCLLNKSEERIDDLVDYARAEHASGYTDFSESNYQLGIKKLKEVLENPI